MIADGTDAAAKLGNERHGKRLPLITAERFPRAEDGGTDAGQVTAIVIVEVSDYH